MKILFIDIDGPLVPQRALYLPKNLGKNLGWQFDPCAVEMINFLLWADPTIRGVVASHRYDYHSEPGSHTKAFWEEKFAENNLQIQLHSEWVTVRTRFKRTKFIEVNDWLNRHPEVSHHCMIDDEADGYKNIREDDRRKFHLVGEDFANGLTWDDFSKMWEFLGQNPDSIFDKYSNYCTFKKTHEQKNMRISS